MKTTGEIPSLGIVGPCTAGKSTLVHKLSGKFALVLRHKAQEHSYVQTMWQKINPPTWLVFLDVSYPETNQRNANLKWSLEEYQEQQRRLAHARAHADFYLMTDGLTPDEVAEQVSGFLTSIGVEPLE